MSRLYASPGSSLRMYSMACAMDVLDDSRQGKTFSFSWKALGGLPAARACLRLVAEGISICLEGAPKGGRGELLRVDADVRKLTEDRCS